MSSATRTRYVGNQTVWFIAIMLTVATSRAQESPAPVSSMTLARVAPLQPDAARKSFVMKDGFEMQLVASEPQVTDPVAAAFDEDGRLYVVEMNDYPYTDKSTDKPNVERTADLPIGKVRLLEDTDNDGIFDRSSIFARDLSWPTGIAVYRGGVFVVATPDVWYLKDEDGDGTAEIRRKLFSGFRKLNVQAVVNNLIWGLDHRIYGAGGTNGGRIASMSGDPAEMVTISRNDFCFAPESAELELLSGGARFGNTFDDWGNRFICNIRNPIQHSVLPQRYLNRNPSLAAGSPMHDVAAAGDQIPVFRASPPEPWRVVNAARLTSQGDPRMPRSEKNAQGFMTSACGVTVYRGDAYPAVYREQVFLAEVAGNLIHRQRMVPSGVTFTSTRIDEESEFAASSDNWFRPVNFIHAPDGTLHILDMYRETIEHPWSMPDDLKAMLDLESGRDRGRIYRLTPPGFQRRKTPPLSKASNEELVELLKHPNAWHRETAHRLLFERRAVGVAPRLLAVLNDESSELGRLHALWTLEGLALLTDEHLLERMKDASPGIREHAVLLAERRLPSTATDALANAIRMLADDPAARVRMQVAFTLGQMSDDRSRAALQSIARRDAHDAWISTAVLSAPATMTSELLPALLKDSEFAADETHLPLLKQLATMTGVQKNPASIRLVVESVGSLSESVQESRMVTEVLLALEEGLRRAGTSLKNPPEDPGDAEIAKILEAQFQRAVVVVQNSQHSPEDRLSAMRVLNFGKPAEVRAIVSPLISTQQPAEIQTAAVRTLAAIQDDDTATVLLDAFAGSTPAVQYEIIEAMSGHPTRIQLLLDAIERMRIPAAQVTPIRRTLLMNHADATIRERALRLLASDRETSRSQVIAAFRDSLDLPSDQIRGRAVFIRECAMCHRMGDTGHDVGPSLITVKHRTAAELLTQILDPNREVGPGFMQFAVALKDGQVLAGMIAEESPSSVTLRKAENRSDVVLRETIEEIKATGISLMPEGIEKKLTAQELADLIGFLKQ